MKIKLQNVIYGILLFVFIFSILPWMKEGLPMTDDYRHHATRIWFVQEQIKNLEYSEWMPNMYGGWPFLHYYHPLFYIISIPVAALFSTLSVLKIMTAVIFALALAATFYAANLLFKDKEIALLAAVAYFLSSHFMFHATVSGALPRLAAIGIAPLVMAFFVKALEEKSRKYAIKGGILLAVLLLMHISVAVPVMIICFVYAIYDLYCKKNIKAVLKPAAMILICFGLAAAWFIPMMLEKEYGNFPESSAKLEAPPLKQTTRTFGIMHDGKNYIRSNYFGYSVLALALLGLVFIKKNKTVDFLKIGFLASLIFYFNLLGLLNFIPFVKTALTGTTNFFITGLVFNAVMLAGAGAKALAKKYKKEYLIYAAVLIIIIELYPSVNAFSYGWTEFDTENFVNHPALVDAWEFIKEQEGNFAVISTIGYSAEIYHQKQEFGFDWVGCPQCVQKITYETHNELWKIFNSGAKDDDVLGYLGVKYYVVPCQTKLENKLAYTNNGVCVYENEKFKPMVDSNAAISSIVYEMDKVSFVTESSSEEEVLVKINNFKPHWKAYVNGKETQINKVWPEFMMIKVPAGKNDIVMDYKTNKLHMFSWFITFLTAALIWWFIKNENK